MIPKAPKGMNGDGPESRRQVLFNLGAWEIVLYKNYTTAYAVHSCQAELPDHNTKEPVIDMIEPGPPRAITKASEMVKARVSKVTCWSCEADIPEEIMTITELFNA